MKEFKNERELQEDLAEFLRESGQLTFTEIQIPGMNSSRADVIAITPHRYSTKDIKLYEVKLTRGVWLSDRKYQKYLDCCNRMYIACPKGVVKKDEVPKEVGLITRGENGWRVVKSPKLNINPPKMNVDFILSLLYRGYEETKIQRDLRDRIIADSNISLNKQAKNLGWEIARRLDKTKESQIEKWCEQLWSMFKDLGFDVPDEVIYSDKFYGERINLPNLWEIEELICGNVNVIKDIAAIKAIGEYLRNIEVPEDNEKYFGRKYKREKAMKMISNNS